MTNEKSINCKYKKFKIRRDSRINSLSEAQKLAFAPFSFQVVGCMLDFKILETINKTPMSLQEVVEKCKVSTYTAKTLFEVAIHIGLIKKAEENKYTTTKLAEAFLYDEMTIANFNFMRDVCYLGANELSQSFKEERPAGLHRFFFNEKTIYPTLTKLPPQVQKSWYEFDHHYSDDCFNEVLKIIFSHNPKRITDIGGNTGKFEKACRKFSKDCEIAMVDLPENIESTSKNFQKGDVQFYPMDILDPNKQLPELTGAVLMSQFLDCFSEEQILVILNKVAKAIKDTNNTKVYILEPFIDNQKYEGAAIALSHISLYFTCMANGNSKMYNESDMLRLIEASDLKLTQTYNNIGKYDYTLLECKKK